MDDENETNAIDKKRSGKKNLIGKLLFFENLPEIIRPEVLASVLGVSIKTIYDWHHRHRVKQIPPSLFLKINRLLYIRRDELKKWIASQNPSLA